MKIIKIPTTLFNKYFYFDLKSSTVSSKKYLSIVLLDTYSNQYFIGQIKKNNSSLYIDIHENKFYEDVKKKFNPAPYVRLKFIDDNIYPYILISDDLYKNKEIIKEIENDHLKAVIKKQMLYAAEEIISNKIHRNLRFGEIIFVHSDELGPTDLSLINSWNGGLNSGGVLKSLSEIEIKKWDLGRLVSARKAEIATLKYLRNFGEDIEDISITQINGNKADWKLYDIRKDEEFYDVKNSRHSARNVDTYTDHTIPRFKKDRMGNEIIIISVLSEYVPQGMEKDFRITKHVILGVITKGTIEKLIYYINKKFENFLDISTLSTATFFPGWIFDYPEDYYEINESSLEFPKGFDKSVLPPWCALYQYDTGLPVESNFNIQDNQIIQDLVELKNNNNFSRPFIFYYVLGQLLKNISNKDIYYEQSKFIKDLLFRDFKTEKFLKRPLGIYDPLQYIKNIIQLFDLYRNFIAEEKYESYKLTHPQILCGIKGDKELTIIAYCGGFTELRGRCGSYPLIIGKNERCKECGKLICNQCDHCTLNCSRPSPLKSPLTEGKRLLP